MAFRVYRVPEAGARFFRLEITGRIIKRQTPNGRRETLFECVCDCGNLRYHRLSYLHTGKIKSCGCYHREAIQKRATTHGKLYDPAYLCWASMIRRCRNPHYKQYDDYGGRGITVCERWNDFAFFLADMGPRPSLQHSIDRIDNDGDYEPSNCRWATRLEQQRNSRVTRHLTYQGRTQALAAWAIEIGVPRRTLHNRINHNWSVERALTTPARRRKPITE